MLGGAGHAREAAFDELLVDGRPRVAAGLGLGDAVDDAGSPSVCPFATATLSAATPTIQLNVGGTIFETTESTLARHPATFFGALARNRGTATRLFVDRDPTHFRHILNYLRSGVVTAPADDDAKAELLLELEFYALHDFARGLCGPVLDLTKHLDAAGVLADRAETKDASAARRSTRSPASHGSCASRPWSSSRSPRPSKLPKSS